MADEDDTSSYAPEFEPTPSSSFTSPPPATDDGPPLLNPALVSLFAAGLADRPPRDPAAAAASATLQAMLATPAAGQLPDLLHATFWLELQGGKPRRERSTDYTWCLLAFTDPTRAFGPLQAMSGEELFRVFVEEDGVDALWIDRGNYLGQGDERIANLMLPVGVAVAALAGRDIRPGAAPLPARTVAEVGLWLDLSGFPQAGRRLVDAPLPDGPYLLRAHVDGPNLAWGAQETLGSRVARPELWSPVFTVDHPRAGENDFGEGPSRILCPGLLAKVFGVGKPGWYPYGVRLGIGRLVGDRDRAFAARRLAIARELAKLLPPGGDSIPRTALLSVNGARTVRDHPEMLGRAWIDGNIRHEERHLRRWVWNWPFASK